MEPYICQYPVPSTFPSPTSRPSSSSLVDVSSVELKPQKLCIAYKCKSTPGCVSWMEHTRLCFLDVHFEALQSVRKLHLITWQTLSGASGKLVITGSNHQQRNSIPIHQDFQSTSFSSLTLHTKYTQAPWHYAAADVGRSQCGWTYILLVVTISHKRLESNQVTR